ncbi:Glucose-6-phosphate 1-dehydrogenase [Poriferisphaera corsica]|uniref:Glucose-6-phosphate 1-dehydrogenase n=1 Tax=Poriferisphaera corsica TaxID=2528020 RepID=A0A517YV96_9BACT|nr:glucose-6-phosphate dehydrogenase [Poriferisphaera corsica]QDU34155.1 Glucose-6-phosphate 1-dehydrogenase [Poriferisphaera corsica]
MPNQNTKPRSNCLIVIFGASGDLTKRKLIPALYSLWDTNQLPANFAILGIARTAYSDEKYRDELYEFSEGSYDKAKWGEFSKHLYYHAGDSTAEADWGDIKGYMCDLAKKHDLGDNRIFYLSVGPQFFEPIITNIGKAELVTEGRRFCSLSDDVPWQRIVVEKPFGSDPASAVKLNQTLAAVFDEESIYRIDHYLGKELVQNLLVVRFANSLFEPLWNREYIDHVQITATETVGVEGRGAYYDSPAGGAMRDMIQSHLLQVLSFMAMEPPVAFEADDIRTEKNKIFKALRIPKYDDVPQIAVRGQYGQGQIGGEPVIGYRDEKGVDEESQTDTFAALQLYIDTWRWGGVPFYLRSGKAMAEKKTEIVIYFKPTPHCLFKEQTKKLKANQIIINVHPNEGIRLRFEGKVPGLGMNIKDVVMDFDYIKQWQVKPSDGYAILLNDVLRGDQMLFKHRDEIEISWNAVQPVLDYWKDNPQDDLPNYNAGTWGPSAADIMMARDNRYWHNY